MIFSNLLAYKVVEFEHGICIVPTNVNFKIGTQAAPFIQADLQTCCEYLQRHVAARLAGKDQPTAHEEALQGAIKVTDFATFKSPGGLIQ